MSTTKTTFYVGSLRSLFDPNQCQREYNVTTNYDIDHVLELQYISIYLSEKHDIQFLANDIYVLSEYLNRPVNLCKIDKKLNNKKAKYFGGHGILDQELKDYLNSQLQYTQQLISLIVNDKNPNVKKIGEDYLWN